MRRGSRHQYQMFCLKIAGYGNKKPEDRHIRFRAKLPHISATSWSQCAIRSFLIVMLGLQVRTITCKISSGNASRTIAETQSLLDESQRVHVQIVSCAVHRIKALSCRSSCMQHSKLQFGPVGTAQMKGQSKPIWMLVIPVCFVEN